MTPERWDRVKKIFADALDQKPADRDIFLRAVCGDDESLRAEVASLLARQSSQPFFKNPFPLCVSPPAGEETKTHVPHEPGSQDKRVPPVSSEDMEGRRIGPYEITRQIGQGGMGSVYLAFRADRAFEKQVAIKFLRSKAQRPDLMGRFHRECRILASLEHPNIARLYDAGTTEDGLPYFIMEYVDGEPIDVWCDRHKLTVSQRLRLFKTVCDAVHYAHQHQVIHRDLKPSNILVARDGTTKLLDFGIAKTLHSDDEQTARTLTRTGDILLTPEYASPEQIRGEPATSASDIYSLGVVLYGLLTARHPYKLTSWVFYDIVRVICEEPPSKPSEAVKRDDDNLTSQEELNANTSAAARSRVREGSPADLSRRLKGDLDNILLKALSKDPFERYRSAQQFGMDLDSHLDAQPVLARAESILQRFSRMAFRRRMEILVALVTLAGVATGAIEVRLLFGIYLLIGLTLFGMWFGATSPKIGRWLDEYVWSNPAIVALGVLPIALAKFGFDFGRGYAHARAQHRAGTAVVPETVRHPSGMDVIPPILLVLCAVLSAFVIGWLLHWLTRERFGGRLVLALESVRPRDHKIIVTTLLGLAVISLLVAVGVGLEIEHRNTVVTLVTLLLLMAVNALVVVAGLYASLRIEVRQNGIVMQGGFIHGRRSLLIAGNRIDLSGSGKRMPMLWCSK